MWVKICGTTNIEDARVAVEAGADALGFVFAPSPRRISPKDAKRIIAELPREVEKIGVFVNQTAEIIRETVESAGLTGVQLHGDEDQEFLLDWKRRRRSIPVYKVVRVTSTLGPEAVAWSDEERARLIRALVLDSGTPERRGGTGRAFDWEETGSFVRLLAKRVKVVVAGGLTPQNVEKAVTTLRPWGVDVVSGVESEAGKKDAAKVRAFVEAAKAAAAQR